MKDLSILIPARNEIFLNNTIEDILKNIEADTEVIVALDSEWADPSLDQHERVNVIYVPEAIGQRAATNLACKLSKARYVMKVDAHCSFDKGFDRKMLEGFKKSGDNVTMVPIMRNLWAFDWKCMKCGSQWYQGPTPTVCMKVIDTMEGRKRRKKRVPNEVCDNTFSDKGFERIMMWIGKERPQSKAYLFDPEPHFRYWNQYRKRPEWQKDYEKTGLTETMCLQGSCFMLSRTKYWELDICNEWFGSWGNQGIETSAKTWLSGGRVLVNHSTWYSHLFRTQGGDFGFPYRNPGRDVLKTKRRVWDSFFKRRWKKQIHPLSWLVEKFWPVPGWEQKDLDKLKEKENAKR